MSPFETLDQHYDAALLCLDPEHVFLMDEETKVLFRDFQGLVRRLLGGLNRAGVSQGHLVGYSVPNSAAAFALPIAISRLGAACLPLYPLVPDTARSSAFTHGRVTYVIVPRESKESFEIIASTNGANYRIFALEDLMEEVEVPLPVARAQATDPFLLTTSSGTTGKPKAVFLTQRNAASSLTAAQELSSYGPWFQRPNYLTMIAFPQSTSGIITLLGIAFMGVTLVFTRSLSPVRFLEIARTVRVDTISAPPAWFEALLSVPQADEQSIESVCGIATGMDFLSPSLLKRLGLLFPSLESVANGYGLVETATVFMIWKGQGRDSLSGPTSVFSLCSSLSNEICVCGDEGKKVAPGEEGELYVRGPSVIERYLDSSEGFYDGWFRTGDIVRFIDSHTVQLRGRNKYVIKRGGKSISPLLVEEAVDSSPGVLRSAVVGIPHPLFGEMIWAFVVARPGEETTIATIMKAVRAILPTHMVPDRIEFVSAIPVGRGVGKVDREALIVQGTALLQTMGQSA
jgi:long-chain acyl-CoA synthetase